MWIDLICVLLIISALAELFGTATVWANYRRGAQVAAEFRSEVLAEEAALAELGGRRSIFESDELIAPYRVGDLEKSFRAARERVADQLSTSVVTTVGLVAYVIGALVGLAAGLVALYH